jgi:tripartite-type tricarboxylate transporter receptor subunit TctC
MKKLVFLLLALALAPAAHAQGRYPDKPVKILVGFPPGTSTDTLTRLVTARMSESLGQPFVVENKPGAGSTIAAEQVARAAPDGYTLLASSSANVVNPALLKQIPFDFQKDLAPIGLIAEAPLLLIAHPSTGLKTVQQLIAAAKAKPGGLAYGSSGIGSFVHLNGELFKMTAGVDLAHVPYKGSSQAISDLLSGQIPLLFTPASTAIPHVRAGKAVALGILSRQRSGGLPEVPTMSEAGVPGLEFALWSGLHAPAGTPREVIERLHRELQKTLAQPDIRERLAAQANDPLPGTPEQFAKMIREDIERWTRVVKTAGIKSE